MVDRNEVEEMKQEGGCRNNEEATIEQCNACDAPDCEGVR